MKTITLIIALLLTTILNAQDKYTNFTFVGGTQTKYFGGDYDNGVLNCNNLKINKHAAVLLQDITVIVHGDLLIDGVARLIMRNSNIIVYGSTEEYGDKIVYIKRNESKIKNFKNLKKSDQEIKVFNQRNKLVASGSYDEIKNKTIPTGVYTIQVKNRVYLTQQILK